MTFPLHNPVGIFFAVLLIILCGTVLFRRIKIPTIVGLILAGMVVGPNGLNLLERDASFQIFGQVGILFLMFLAAAEIDMFHLRRNLKAGASYGLLTFLLPAAGGLLGSHYLLGCGWATSVLMAVIYSSHTLVSYPVISRFGLQNSRAAIVAVCSTIVAVLLALFMLAELVAVDERGSFDAAGLLSLLLLMSVYAVVVGWLFPRLTRWFFKKVSESVSQFIFILMLVFLASLLAQLIGLEAILGAFFAGLVLNKFIPLRSALMRHIQFAGNALFIPYFLIGVGMLINVRAVFTGWGVGWAALNMTAWALASKWLSAFIMQKALRMDSNDRRLMYGLTSGKAAATIAAAMIGYQHGLMDEDMMNGAVVMILGCCIVASVVTERSALRIRKRLTEEELRQDPGTDVSHYARQLVAVSNPITSEGLVKMALMMRYDDNREPVTVLFVRSDDSARSVTNGRNALDSALRAGAEVDIDIEPVERYDLNIVAGVTNVAKERRATDLMLGMHSRSTVIDSFYGETVSKLLERTSKMIFLSRCFVPVDTLSRILIYVPQNAEYETGFQPWVERVSNLASATGCAVVFLAYRATSDFLRNTLAERRVHFRYQFRYLDTWDDFILATGDVGDEDLMIVVAARRGSLSWSGDMEMMPGYLGRNFKRHNLMVIYPEQFGGHDSGESA